MKFIFPTNYNFTNKFLGILDYHTIILNFIWFSFIFCLLNLIFINLTIKIFLFMTFCLPLLLFSIIGFNHENILYVLWYLLKFFSNRKIYLYYK